MKRKGGVLHDSRATTFNDVHNIRKTPVATEPEGECWTRCAIEGTGGKHRRDTREDAMRTSDDTMWG